MLANARMLLARLIAITGAIFWSPLGAANDADRIDVQDLRRQVEQGQAVIVDVRTRAAWEYGHIQGAIHIPLDELEARLSQLPRNKLIATYCTWGAEATSARAALKLKEAGFPRVAALRGGMAAWEKAGGRIVTGAR